MRFGVFIPQGWRFDLVGVPDAEQWPLMRRLAQHADQAPGWESMWVYDHFHTTPVPSEEATHEAWTLMSAFAASTERIRLGQMCTCMAYRNPGYLAKVAATVDHVSGGRLEMGIGAGWYEHEWRAYGYGFPSAKERLGRLREGVQIFQQAWTTGHATLDGTYYQVDDLIVRPLPIQRTSERNNIPIWIAGGGEQVTLKIAARYADYTNFDGSAEGFAHKSEILAAHCTAVGRDIEQITRSANYNVITGTTEAEVAERLAQYRDRMVASIGEAAADEYHRRTTSQGLIGTPEQIIETLRAREALGMTYAITYHPLSAYDLSSQELFETQVIPAFGG